METLMKELSNLLEEKNRRIESLEWQLKNANEEIKMLKMPRTMKIDDEDRGVAKIATPGGTQEME